MTPIRGLAFPLLVSAPTLASADYAGVSAAKSGDYETARREWLPLAETGHRDAQFNLALLYENGLGVAADAAKAAYWFERAADQGDRTAQAYLGEMYANGLGVERDDVVALKWSRRAAELGDAVSQYNVGFFYAMGRGIEPSDVQAYAWLTVGMENGAPRTELRDKLARHMSAAHLEEAKALVLEVRKACKLP
ncbi:MAG: tetratricopeptide repeat protein [Betaproteobacteria bacterium]